MGIQRYRGELVGTADVAGQMLTRPVSAHAYQRYVKERGAPGPISWTEPGTRKSLYPLRRIPEWDATRPGAGARTDLPGGHTASGRTRQEKPREQWAGDSTDFAVIVTRGTPARSDADMIATIGDQVTRYLTEHPPRTPTAEPVDANALRLLGQLVATERVEPDAATILVTREELLIALGTVYGVQRSERTR